VAENFTREDLDKLAEGAPIIHHFGRWQTTYTINDDQKALLLASYPAFWRVASLQTFASRVTRGSLQWNPPTPQGVEGLAQYVCEKSMFLHEGGSFSVKVHVAENSRDAVVPSDANAGGSSFLTALWNIGQMPLCDRKTLSELWSLTIKFLAPDRTSSDVESFRRGSHTVLAPMNMMSSSQPYTIEAIQTAGTEHILIPIAQYASVTGPLTGNEYVYRAHWTLLHLQRVTSEPLTFLAFHIDSKGPHSWLTEADPLAQLTPPGADVPFHIRRTETSYLAHQGLTNTKDCGYFVLAYMNAFLNGRHPATLSTEEIRLWIQQHFTTR
jgi:hypothetical protein